MHSGLPSTTLTMIFSLDGPVVEVPDHAVGSAPAGLRSGDEAPTGSRADLVLAGLHTAPVLIAQPTHQEGIQLQLDPLAARTLFGVRAADLVGGFDGIEVLGHAGRNLWEQVGETVAGPERLAQISRAFRARCATSPASTGHVRPELVEAWRLVLASRGRISMDSLARHVALSPRQLRTEFTRELGIGPKSAARLARFEAALTLIAGAVHAGRNPDLSDLAAETGYADHAHLTREFGRFAGTAPSLWIRQERRNLQAGGHGTAED